MSPQSHAPETERIPARCCQQPLAPVAVSLAAGITVDHYWPMPIAAWLAAGVALFTWWLLARTLSASRRQLRSSLALLAAVAAFGGALHHWHWHIFRAGDIARFAPTDPAPLAVEAIALSSPRFRSPPPPDPLRSVPQGPRTELRLEITSLRDGDDWRAASGKAKLRVDGELLGIHAGDTLRIFGRLARPDSPGNPGEFDFAAHHRADRQLADLHCDSPNSVTVVASASQFYWRRVLGDIRAAGNRVVKDSIDPDRASLASAILLGSREYLDDDLTDDLLVTGTIHLISISGLHVGILAAVLLAGFRWGLVPRAAAVFSVAAATVGYTLLTDSEPPAIRATVLVWVVCGAILFGRQAIAFNTLALAAILVLLINPADLFRVGTQLSFLSMAVLIWFAPWWSATRGAEHPLDRLIRRTRPVPVQWLGVLNQRVLALTVVGVMIWLVTVPLVLHRFHVVSLSALVLNVFLTPFVFFAMACGFGMLAFAWLLPPLGRFFGWLCNANLAVIQTAIETTATFPASHFWSSGPALWWLVGFYAIAGLWLIRPRNFRLRFQAPMAGCFAAAALLVPLPHSNIGGELECGFIAVGHGCAVLLELPDGQKLLYDAGRLGSPSSAARSVEAYLRSRSLSRLNALIISHADIDHFNAVPTLLEKFSVDRVYVSPQMFRYNVQPLGLLRDAIDRSGAELVVISQGDRLPTRGDCQIEVLHPPADALYGADNAHSLVLAVKSAGRRLLLTGDLEPPGVQSLLAQPPLDCDVLLAPHHGSPRSDPAAIVNWCTPEYAVISSHFPLSDSRYEPYQRLLGPRAHATRDTGAVRVRLGASGVDVRTWRRDPW